MNENARSALEVQRDALLRSDEPAAAWMDDLAARVLPTLVSSLTEDHGPELRPGQSIGTYRLLSVIGRGGMGVVFRARDEKLRRTVAMKFLVRRAWDRDDAVQRLLEEARTVARLDHPGIVAVHEVGETADGQGFIVMAYCEGETLAERLAERAGASPLPIAEGLTVARQVAEALAAAHRAGVVHCDVKPSNIILGEGGRVTVVDFGIAGRGRDGSPLWAPRVGTLPYMAPEQLDGDDVDARADVWSLGVVLYEMLAGERPFQGAGAALEARIRAGRPRPLDEVRSEIPPELARLVGRCLAARREDRPATAADVLEALDALPSEEPARVVPARGPSRARSLRPSRRPVGRTALAVALSTLLLVAAGFYLATRSTGATGEVHPSATTMTILPFVPVPEDTALRSLGRQLAVTVSANLDGFGPIRTASALSVLGSVPGQDGSPRAEGAAALARRLDTGSYLFGTLLGEGGRVRLDAALYEAETEAEIARISVAGPRDSIAPLTDSITVAVMRAVWREGEIPAPNLAAITTSSVPALRSYLEGELLLAGGRFAEAVRSFEAAFREDSTFWYALWRSIYPRSYEGTAEIEPEHYERLYANRHDLPEPDRLLIESRHVEERLDQLEARLEVTRRFPAYWPGWWEYANMLVHAGPLLGRPLADARGALERVLELQPSFVPAWEHLFWVAGYQRDAQRAGEALGRMQEAARVTGTPRLRRDMLPTYRAKYAALRDGHLSDEAVARKAEAVLEYHGRLPPLYFAVDLLMWGEPVAQLQVSRALRAARPVPEIAEHHRFGSALALAGGGDWDRAIGLLEERALAIDSIAPFTTYALAVMGTWLGEVTAERSRTLRSASVATSDTGLRWAEAELSWLDGIAAYAAGNSVALDSARRALDRTASEGSSRLAGSLEAFALALRGDSARAGKRLAELEETSARTGAYHAYGRQHPWLTPVNRLAAGHWLAASGDTTRALRLLGWEEAVLTAHHFLMEPAGMVLSPHSSLLRSRLYAGLGDDVRAAFHRETYRRRHGHALVSIP